MNVANFINVAIAWLMSFGLSADQAVMVLHAINAIITLIGMYFSYRMIRIGLGHRKYRSSWVSGEEYDKLMQMLQDMERQGRIIQHEDAVLLDEYRYGGKSTTRKFFSRGVR
jgi:hypothetical protein